MPARKMPTLDLHGRTGDEVFGLLDQFITKHKRCKELRVIVGRGRGIVKQRAVEYLKGAHYPWRHERAHSGVENPGALILDLS